LKCFIFIKTRQSKSSGSTIVSGNGAESLLLHHLLSLVRYVRTHGGQPFQSRAYPIAFIYQENRWDVSDIVDRRYEGAIKQESPVIDYFKDRTIDGQVFLLRYVSLFDSWSVSA
jgi:hypothetical protein